MKKYYIFVIIFLLLYCAAFETFSQNIKKDNTSNSNNTKWFKNLKVGAYFQLRNNKLVETNSNLKCEQCNKSWGEVSTFKWTNSELGLK